MLSNFVNGIEVLLKKAAVDAEFCGHLKGARHEAAKLIQLQLGEIEVNILRSIPLEQLDALIRQTTVPEEQIDVFRGNDSAAMLNTIRESEAWANYSILRCGGGIRPQTPASNNEDNQ